jgi:beta-barrel assembly-enhancing protease
LNLYKANAFAPETKSKPNPGTLTVSSAGLRFESPTVTGTLPLNGLVVRRGGHNDEQIFFEHPEFPGWSIYTSDAAIGAEPALASIHAFAREIRAVERSRKSTPKPVIFGLVFLALLFVGVILLWTQKDRIAERVAERIPISWEQKFGDRMFEHFEQDGTILTNSAWAPAVSNITTRLLPAVSKSGYDFNFHIKQDTNINAFAMPGGHVVILTGLLEHADSAEEVAGVLAHEIAHVTRRHSLRNIVKSAGLLVVLQAAVGDASGLLAMAADASRYLLEQKFSRDFEREADDNGWSYLVESNIDPRGMTRFFEKLKKLTANSPVGAMEDSLSLINTHPATQERIDRLTEKWNQLPKKSGFADLGKWSKPNAKQD